MRREERGLIKFSVSIAIQWWFTEAITNLRGAYTRGD